MATATVYDMYDDAGLAFSDEECAAYRPKVWAEARVTELGKMIVVLKRREAIPELTKPQWWKGVREGLERAASWYCVSQDVPALTEEQVALPSVSSAAFKALAKQAQELKEDDWLGAYTAAAEANMRHVVTLGRRCGGNTKISGWGKLDKKASNKLANCIMKELSLSKRLSDQLLARA